MKCDKNYMLLYGVTDRAWTGCQSLYEQAEAALKGGVTCIQLREKGLEKQAFLEEAIALKELCKRYNTPLIINDNVEIALECQADGIHVGQDDLSPSQVRKLVGNQMIIGVSAHSVAEALEAEKSGADYLGVGAMFTTSTKTDARPLPFQTLQAICQAVSIPVVAIGGINKANILELSGSGADGVALVSAIFGAKDIEAECRELKNLAKQMIMTQEDKQ